MLPVLLVLAAAPSPSARPPSFLNEVVPLLTRAGCNQGACHGKGAGQNGFRLSLRGYAPADDHRWLTREFAARRVDPADPASSLLLRKATAQTPHEGGRLFPADGREYRLLADWLRAGSPGPAKDDPKLVRLELTPGSHTLTVGQRHSLTAVGVFSDGSRRDVTWLTKFDANEPAVVDVSPAGVATAKRNGSAAVRAMFQSEVAVAVFAVPFSNDVDPKRYEGGTPAVDRPVLAKLKELRIEPSGLCTDAEFVRRVYLDACGRLPPPSEVTAFLADSSPDKRAKLIDRVLASPEYTDYWTLQLGDLLQNRKERDHDVRGTKGVRQFHAWLREQVAANRPWDKLARDVLTASGKTTDSPAVGYYVVTVGEHREAEKSEVAESVAQAFLGVRIGCARCHNHPLERYTQDDFYHFAAFFSRVKLDRKDPKTGPTTLRVAHRDGPERNGSPVGTTQPRTGQFLKPQPLDRTRREIAPGTDPRAALADWVTNPANGQFAGAMVNRLVRHYLGVGLVEPVDDLRATNPPSVPALWDSLSAGFVSSGYDLRQLARTILLSDTYQRSSGTVPGNATDTRFYSHYPARRLPAEVLLDAIGDVTGVGETFDGYPAGVRAVQVPDPGAQSYFLRLFGRSERTTACACERTGEVTMPQLLHLQNGERVLAKLRDGNGWLEKSLKAEPNDDKLTDALFLRALARLPRPEERAAVKAALAAGDGRAEVYRDLCWAVLNAKEFAFNH